MPLNIFENGRISKFMDHEYLQNMLGSPYVNEGGFDQLKAKAAQAMGAAGAMAGHQIQNPTETKLRSLWEGFMSSLKKAMKDWEGQVSPMFDEQVPLNEKQQQAKDALDMLARLLSSVGPQPIGTFPPGEHDPRVRNQRDNPETYVKGSAYNRSTTSPPKTPSKLTEIMDEGFWDAAKRDVGLNKSLGSNDPSTILDSYKNYVLSIFQNFMKDAIKMTKMTAQQVYSVLAKMQPAKGGWQAAGNMQKVVEQLKTLQSLGDIKGTGEPPVINPPADAAQQPQAQPQAPQPEPEPEPQAQQPQAQPQPQPQAQQPQTTPQAGASSTGAGVQGGSWQIPADKLPFVILRAIEIVTNVISADKDHVGNLFEPDKATGKLKPLPTSVNQDALLNEPKKPVAPSASPTTPSPTTPPVTEVDAGNDAEPGNQHAEEEDEPFLYRFRSKYRWKPAGKFAIEVKPANAGGDGEPVGWGWKDSKGNPVKLKVWWMNEKHKNQIYAVAVADGKESEPTLIMQFFDHQVDSKAGATNPDKTNPASFSTDKIIKAANPTGGNPLAKAPPEVQSKINQLQDRFLRSLYATAVRKTMEFVPKIKTFDLAFDEEGGVTIKTPNGEKGFSPEEVESQLTATLKGKDGTPAKDDMGNIKYTYDAKRWHKSLEEKGYFKKFPDPTKKKDATSGTPSPSSTLPAVEAAVQDLVNKGWPKKTAYTKTANVVDRLKKLKNDGDPITPEEIVTIVMDPLKMPVPAAYRDAVEAAKKMGYKPDEADSKVMEKWLEFKKTTPVENIDKDELVKAVLSGKTPSAAPAPAPAAPKAPEPTSGATVSKPASQPAPTTEPTAPVSGGASGPAPSKEPTAPVSTDQPEPDKGQGQQPQQPQQPQPETGSTKFGPVKIRRKQIEWEHPKTHEVHLVSADQLEQFAKKQPKFAQALKSNPELYQKFKDMIEKDTKKPEGGAGGKPPVAEGIDYINPFNRDNLLY